MAFTKQVHVEPSHHVPGAYIAHEKYVLTPDTTRLREAQDLVVCLIVRRTVPPDITAQQLNESFSSVGEDVELDLRQMAEDYDWLK